MLALPEQHKRGSPINRHAHANRATELHDAQRQTPLYRLRVSGLAVALLFFGNQGRKLGLELRDAIRQALHIGM